MLFSESTLTFHRAFLFVLGLTTFLFFASCVNSALADTLVDPTVIATNSQTVIGSPNNVCIDDLHCFIFFREAGVDIEMASSTDGGLTWSASTQVDNVNTADAVGVAIWWDGWTPGTTTTRYIHIATIDTGVDDLYYTAYDTVTNTFSTSVVATTQVAACTAAADCYPTITMTATGTLYMATSEAADRFVVKCNTTCTTSGNWGEITGGFQGTAGDDYQILMPIPGTDNVLLTWWDASADAIYYNIYSATSSSWVYATTMAVDATADDNTTYDAQLMGMALSTTTGEIALTFVDDANDYSTQDHDIKFYLYSSSTGWVAKTNPVTTAVGGLTGAKVAYDAQNNTWYVVYARRSTIGTNTTAHIFYTTSTDGGTTWSGELGPITERSDDINGLTVDIHSRERIAATWNYTTSPRADQQYYTTIKDIVPPYTLTLAGVLYTDRGVTPYGTVETVAVVIGTSTQSKHTTTSSAVDGTYTITINDAQAGSGVPLTFWIDDDASDRGALLTKLPYASSSLTGLNLYENHTLIRSENEQITPTNLSSFYSYDNTDDTDLRFIATIATTSKDLAFLDEQTLLVLANSNLLIDTPLNTHDFEVATSGMVRASTTLTLTGDYVNNGTMYATSSMWVAQKAVEANQWFSVIYGGGFFVAVSTTGTNRVMTSPDGITWTARSATEANSWNSITYGNGLFVAVAWDGTNRVMTSPDGITWTARSAAEANAWSSVTYGGGLFVAVAEDGINRVMTSPDGITWTARAAAEANQWYDVTYGNGLFVAVTWYGTNQVMTSPDGITWTSRSAAEANYWRSVTYGDGLFVAVSTTGTNCVMTSPDGITWTARLAAEANQWYGVTYGGGLFVAVSYNGTNQVMTSPDGITWTARIAAETNSWYGVTYGNGRFVAVTWTGTNRVMTSSGLPELVFNGVSTQTLSGSMVATSTILNLVFKESGSKTFAANASTTRFTIATSSGTVIAPSALTITGNIDNRNTFTAPSILYLTGSNQTATGTFTGASALNGVTMSGGVKTFYTNASSTDLTIAASATFISPLNFSVSGTYVNNGNLVNKAGLWTAHAAAEANGWLSVTYGNGLFVAVSSNGTNRVMTSPDGITWTARTAAEANYWNAVTYGNGLFVAVAGDGTNQVMTSPDGITWTAHAAAEANAWSSVTYGDGLFVAVSSNGTNRIMTSPDGITWTSRTGPEANNWTSVTYGNGLFVAVSWTGTNRVMTSPDGITWTERTAVGANEWHSVTYGNGTFVAVAGSGTNRVMTSLDGITWTARSAAEANNWLSVTYGNGLFVAVAWTGTNRVMTSLDGITWTARSAAEDGYWYSVIYGNGLFVAVSSYGTNRVMTSTDATTIFSGTTTQSINGNLTGTSAFGNLTFTGAGSKTFNNNASTTNFTINSGSGDVVAPAELSIIGDYSNSSVFDAGTGTTTFAGEQPQTATGTLTGTSAFYNLAVTNQSTTTFATTTEVTNRLTLAAPGGVIALPASATTTVATLIARGTGLLTNEPVKLRSTLPGTQANLVVTSTSSVTYVDIKDSNVCGSVGGGIIISTLQAIDSGNNNCWTFNILGEGQGITVSGILYEADRTTPAGSNQAIAVNIGGDIYATYSTTTRGTTGVFSLTVPDVSVGTGTVVTIYANGNTSLRAVTVTKLAATTTVTNLPLYEDHVVVRNEATATTTSTASTTVADMASFDYTKDIDIKFTASASTHTLTLSSGQSLYVAASTTFLGGTVVVPDDVYIATTSTYIASTSLTVTDDFHNAGTYTTAGAVWGSASSTAANNWIAVTYGNGLFVATGYDWDLSEARVMTSPDGITWTARTAAENIPYQSITYGNSLFVAVGYDWDLLESRVMTSPDGITWTARTIAEDHPWWSVTYGNGRFVAVGYDDEVWEGRIMTSVDGINWTLLTPTDDAWSSVTYGNGLFVAVAYDYGTNQVKTSPDGITWTARTPAEATGWDAVTYGNGLFVAVGGSGTSSRVMSSPDGITWTAHSVSNTSINDIWNSITYGNGLFVAVGRDTVLIESIFMSSSDGITWTNRTTDRSDNIWRSVTYANGRFVAVGYDYDLNEGRARLSLDATTTFSGTSQTISGSLSGASALGNTAFSGAGTKTFANNASTTNLVISTGSTVTAPSALTIHGHYTNSGTYTMSAGTTTFAGSADQTLSGAGTTNFADLRFTDNGNKTLASAYTANNMQIATSSGVVTLSTTTLTLTGYFDNDSTYNSRTGTTTFAGTSPQTVSGNFTGSSTLGSVSITNTSTTTFSSPLTVAGIFSAVANDATIILPASATTTVGILELLGANGEVIKLRSTNSGTQANLVVATSTRINFADIKDSNACGSVGGGITVYSFQAANSGNNTCWTFSGINPGEGVEISGTLYESDRITPVSTPQAVTVNVGGDNFLVYGTTTEATTGNFTMTIPATGVSTSTVLTMYVDANVSLKAVTVTKVAATSTPIALALYEDHITVKNEATGTTTKVSDLYNYDSTDDSDIKFTASSTLETLTVDAGQTLYVASGTTFHINNPVTTHSFETATTATALASSTLTLAGNYINNGNYFSAATTSWTARTASVASSWRYVTYGNGLFVAVANAGAGARVMTSPDGVTWTSRTAPEANGWRSVVYGNGMFVAISLAGTNRIMTSPDGITWTARAATEANDWRAITYGGGLFVAVADTGTNRVMTSPDGITWTARSVPSYPWFAVTYGNGIFIAVGSSGGSMTSSDGITWTYSSNPSVSSRNIGYGNGLFVVVGNYDIATSPDGVTWTSRTGAGSDIWYGITYGDGLFVATAETGTNRVLTSPDGITWTAQAATAAVQWYGVAYGAGQFVAVGYSGSNVMTRIASNMITLDGSTAQTLSGTMVATSTLPSLVFKNAGNKTFNNNASTTDITIATSSGAVTASTSLTINGNFSNSSTFNAPANLYMSGGNQTATGTWTGAPNLTIAGTGNKTFYTNATTTNLTISTGANFSAPAEMKVVGDYTNNGTSTNLGTVWTARTAAEASYWRSVTYGNGLFVAVAWAGTNRVMTSPDGITWTARSAAEANWWYSVTYGNGLFVAVSYDGTNRVMTSPDGITWTARAAAELNQWTSVTYGNGLFVAVANSGTNQVMTSQDGITWTSRAAGANSWWSVTYGNGLFVAVAIVYSTNYVMTSPDGITWTVRTAAENNTWTSVTYGNGLFVAVASNGTNRVMTSPDGITWTARSATAASYWYSVTYGNGLFVAVAYDGTNCVMYSTDGTSWTPASATEANTWRSVTYGNGLFVAVSENGTNRVMTSSAWGTTTFSGTSPQSITGSLSGASSLGNVALTGAGTKTFSSAASTTNLSIQTTATTTFNGVVSGTSLNITAPAATVAFAASTTNTFETVNIAGTSGNEVKLRSTEDGTQFGFAIADTYDITYADIKDSIGSSTLTGAIAVSDGTSINSGNNEGWNFGTPLGEVPLLSSAANQIFTLGQSETAIETITITDAIIPTVTAANDIRIVIATSTASMLFDGSDTTANFGGTAASKVSGTVSYEGGDSVLVIPVETNFDSSDTLTISGLSFTDFTDINTATSALALYLGGAISGTASATDDKTVTITGSLTLANHTEGQVNNAFSSPSWYELVLQRFKLTADGETATLATTTFTIQGVGGIEASDISNVRLYQDVNQDGDYDGGDTLISSSSLVSIDGQSGTIAIGLGNYALISDDEFILIGDVVDINSSDYLKIVLNANDIEAIGVTTSETITLVGSVDDIQHNRGGMGTRSSASLDPIGGHAPTGTVVTGGEQGGGIDEVDTNTGGDTLGDSPSFFAPTAQSGSWTAGANGINTDGAYATATGAAYHVFQNFDFNIPDTNQITGIEVKLEASATTNAGDIYVQLSWNNASTYSSAQNTGTLTTSDTVYTLGSAGDSWGHSWTPGETTNGNFVLRVLSNPNGNTVQVDAIRVRVYHQATGGGGGGGGGEARRPGLLPLAGFMSLTRTNSNPDHFRLTQGLNELEVLIRRWLISI